MPLVVDERGLLAPGVHPATIDEIADTFGRFQRSDRRLKLLAKLRGYLEGLRRARFEVELILDGSFVMSGVDEPEDIDAILVLPANWDRDAELTPAHYNLISRRWTQREYSIEVFPAVAGTERERYWVEFFAQVNVKWCEQFGWPAEVRKGLVKVSL